MMENYTIGVSILENPWPHSCARELFSLIASESAIAMRKSLQGAVTPLAAKSAESDAVLSTATPMAVSDRRTQN